MMDSNMYVNANLDGVQIQTVVINGGNVKVNQLHPS